MERALELATIQNLLYSITPETYDGIRDKLTEFSVLKTPEGVSSLAHIFRVGSRVRASAIELFTKLVIEIDGTFPGFKSALLFEIFERQHQNIGRYYFLYQLVKSGFYQIEQILEKIRQYQERGIACEQRALYIWFAPELKQLDPELDIHAPEDEDLDEEESSFFDRLDALSADDWKLMKEIRDKGLSDSPVFSLLMNDDVDGLAALDNLDPKGTFPPCCYNRFWQLQDSPSAIHVAAYFGARKCFDYLLSKGADRSATDERGRKTWYFAMYNGHVEFMDSPDEDYSSALAMSAGHHQNALRKQLIERDPSLVTTLSDKFVLHQACGSGNMDAVIYCLNQGADLKKANGVCFTFIREKLAYISPLLMETLIL